MSKTALTGVRVFDGARLTESTTVVIDGAVIGSDATDAEIVDGTGATLLPGLFDAHVHLLTPDDLRALAAHGVTTARHGVLAPRARRLLPRAGAGHPQRGPAGHRAGR
ncbi:hypothetical protein [Amycolatopsis sp. cmx-4-68]|uniref:hypothetical protein n=1 Tax=Amycolatopsis sp. cmx-4-68 TaxID=2790938 RepID=UPI00397945C8